MSSYKPLIVFILLAILLTIWMYSIISDPIYDRFKKSQPALFHVNLLTPILLAIIIYLLCRLNYNKIAWIVIIIYVVFAFISAIFLSMFTGILNKYQDKCPQDDLSAVGECIAGTYSKQASPYK